MSMPAWLPRPKKVPRRPFPTITPGVGIESLNATDTSLVPALIGRRISSSLSAPTR